MTVQELPRSAPQNDAEDLEIIELYFARSESAIERTAEKYGKRLTAVSRGILKDETEAEECVNDAYFRAWQTIPPERPNVLAAYLIRITRNLSLDRYRGRFAGKRAAGEYAASLDELADSVAGWEAMAPDRMFDDRRLAEAINAFLLGQKKLVRRIFVCRYFYTMSVRDIARRFGVGESYVKVNLSRTRTKLKDYLKKEGFVV